MYYVGGGSTPRGSPFTNPDLQPTRIFNRLSTAGITRGCALLSGLPADLDRHVRYYSILLDQVPGGFPRHLTQSSSTPGPRVEHTPEPLGRPGRQSGSPAIRGRSRQFAVPLVAAQRDMKGERGAEGCRWSSRLADQFAYRLGRLGRGGGHVQTSSGAPSTTLVAQQIC